MDYPYIILLLILFLLAFLEWKFPFLSKRTFNLACWLVFIFVAFRAPVVGADTWNYWQFATGVRDFYHNDFRELEFFYLLYNNFFRNYCPIGLIFMVINTIIIFSPIRYILNKYVERKTLSILCFFLFFAYAIFFVALRQMIALSIILWGVICVSENKKNRWFIFVVLSLCAYFFHTTAAIAAALFLTIYFIPLKSKGVAYAAIILSAILGIVLESFDVLNVFSFISSLNIHVIERLSVYLEAEELNELLGLNITLRRSFVGILAFWLINRDKLNHWFSKIYLFGIVLYNLFCSVPMVERMFIGNSLFVIVVFVWGCENSIGFLGKKKYYANLLLILTIIYFTRSYILSHCDYDLESSMCMHPYYFVWEDYSDHPSITRW